MDQVFPILILTVLTGLCLVAFFVTLQAFFSRVLERSRSIAAESASRSFSIGLVNVIFFIALGVALLSLGQNTGVGLFFVLALLIGLILLIGILFGTTAMVLLLKDRLFPGQLGNRPLALAGSVATLACLTPYIGWFGLFPYLVFRGMGAYVMTIVEMWREERQARTQEKAEVA